MRKFSIIVPTLNRSKYLCRMLESVFEQTLLPYEIIIVDQSNNDETLKVVEHFNTCAKELGIVFSYLYLSDPGLTRARNIGLEAATGNFVTFLDDDVILDKKYMEEVSKTIDKHGAIVVQGKITNYHDRFHFYRYLIQKLFMLSSPSEVSSIVYPSFGNVLPVRFQEDVICMWASGCNHTIRTDIAREFKYDENLIAYGLGEDVDITFRIYRQYPRCIWANPLAKISHYESPGERLTNEKYLYMEAVHRYYLFYKNGDNSLTSKLSLAWSRIGYLSITTPKILLSSPKKRFKGVTHLFLAELFVLQNVDRVQKLDLAFFHHWFNNKSRANH